MILYFSKEGKLTTMTPHDEIPRQCGELNIYAIIDCDDSYLNYKQLQLRFKKPGKSVFGPDIPMDKKTYTFNKLEGENIGDLIDGKTYNNVFHVNLSKTPANKQAGNLDIVFTLYSLIVELDEEGLPKNDEAELSDPRILGKTTIFIEESLGLAPFSSIGMTPTEYENLMLAITRLQEDVTTNRVGILRVGDYDERTGEVSLLYDDDIVDDILYNSQSGEMTIKW